MSDVKKVVLAYSGGLDTSVIIPWLKETYDCEVIAYAADLGQGEELDPVHDKALKSGASKVFIEDLKEELVEDFILPTLRADAVYEHKYLLATSLARPLIAKRQVEIAHQEGADAVSHGATGKGNDQVRFELTYRALDPSLRIIACWREPEWTLTSREEAIEYAKARDIPVPVTAAKPYSMDRNLWHLSFEGGILEDPANAPDPEMFLLTVDPLKAPDTPELVEIEFESGRPVALNGEKKSPYEIIAALNEIAGRNGVGRIDIVEDRLVGMKSRGVYECPAAVVLYAAHRELFFLTHDKRTLMFRQQVANLYSELVYNGEWYSQLRENLDAFIDKCEEVVTGKVRLSLFKGSCTPVGRESPNSLYSTAIATFGDSGELYSHSDGTGFIKLFGLPLEIRGRMNREKS
ncbi:MAG: argininosuccinate synthase [Candidatus Omnitrophica bacterium]|nr:argininosuccinate synthase [Candidatus Omnitrophota bacterium]MCA9426027.1 argininosuccinate synthase [Candidatus Omnitrophota bacterium]MCA9430792.1 argininosuccinate synthase [Candidatus Omnitrophota bacterium]MCA9444330.1 argininosuccinate synthase [Candidatus Omnitrophota bacterium]MCA9447995.1 argininosuccinate synthase [Candidatus Omnitrophota bacterium]